MKRLLALAAFLLVGTAHAATYYVDISPTGCGGGPCSNSNNGLTEAAAFRDPQGCIDNMRGGDTCRIKPGVYVGNGGVRHNPHWNFGYRNGQLTSAMNGTSSQYTIIEGWDPTGQGRKPQFCWNASCTCTTYDTPVIGIGNEDNNYAPWQYFEFRNLHVKGGFTLTSDNTCDNQMIRYIRVLDSEFECGYGDWNDNHAVLMLLAARDVYIARNYLHNTVAKYTHTDGVSGQTGLFLEYWSRGITFEYNTLHVEADDVDVGVGIVALGQKGWSTDMVYRYNVIVTDRSAKSIWLQNPPWCGNQICDYFEDSSWCSADCDYPTDPSRSEWGACSNTFNSHVYGNVVKSYSAALHTERLPVGQRVYNNTFVGGSTSEHASLYWYQDNDTTHFNDATDNRYYNNIIQPGNAKNLSISEHWHGPVNTWLFNYNIYKPNAQYRTGYYSPPTVTYSTIGDWRAALVSKGVSGADANSQELTCTWSGTDMFSGTTFYKPTGACDTTGSGGVKIGAFGVTSCVGHNCGGTINVYTPHDINLTQSAAASNGYTAASSFIPTATFTHTDGSTITTRGFWDGGQDWIVRVAFPKAGTWTYTTTSTDAGLTTSGQVTVSDWNASEKAANPLRRGWLERNGTHAWKLSDGTNWVPIGDTQWAGTYLYSEAEWQDWMDALDTRNINTVLVTAWLGIYGYDRSGVSLHPFGSSGLTAYSNGQVQSQVIDPTYFQQLDSMIAYANSKGIQVGIMIGGFPDDSGWFSKFNTQELDDRWFRYIVRRYWAYNVRWLLYGEYDEASKFPPSWVGPTQNASAKYSLVRGSGDGTVNCSIVGRTGDPCDHPVGNHHGPNLTDSNVTLADYLEWQTPKPRTESEYIAIYNARSNNKPVWSEEYWYDKDSYQTDGNTCNCSSGCYATHEVGTKNTHRNFLAGGAFMTFGSKMRVNTGVTPNGSCTTAEKNARFVPTAASLAGKTVENYLLDNDDSLKRMGYFAGFFGTLNTGDYNRKNCGNDSTKPCARFGSEYGAMVTSGTTSITLDVSDNPTGTVYSVTRMNIHNGTQTSLGNYTPSANQITVTGLGSVDYALRFVPQQVSAPFCGDGIAEGTEVCDGSDLQGETCISQGYIAGVLSCYGPGTAAPCTFNFTGCESQTQTPTGEVLSGGALSGGIIK